MNKVITLTKITSKVGVSGLAIYTTNDLGFWGNSEQGEKLYHQLGLAQLKNALPEEVSSQLPELSVPEELNSTVGALKNLKELDIWSYYNYGVQGLCASLLSLPETVTGWGEQAVDLVKENLK